jgi:glucose-6-phosphate isomerase
VKEQPNLIINNNIPKSFLKGKYKKNSLVIRNFLKKLKTNIDKNEDAFYTLSKNYKFYFSKKKLAKYKKFKTIIIIGMGGSILGAKAIYSFMQHKIKKNFIFFDNLEEKKIHNIIKNKKIEKPLFLIISKSGNTIETLINLNLLNNYKSNASNTILITEKSNNTLVDYSKKNKIPIIEHRKYIGGRYSVLSEVGMVPAYLMGFKIANFRKNILKYFENKNQKKFTKNTSEICNIYLSKKINSIIFLDYSHNLKNFLYWAQQLLAESLGKNKLGLMPFISLAPKDHHSLLQLYLDGPKDKIFYIFSSKNLYDYKTSKNYFKKNSKFLNNKYLSNVISSQRKALIKVLKNKKIPFREIEIKKLQEETIGELFSYFMIETFLIGKALGINPFDQPAVEEIKVLTKRYLG